MRVWKKHKKQGLPRGFTLSEVLEYGEYYEVVGTHFEGNR